VIGEIKLPCRWRTVSPSVIITYGSSTRLRGSTRTRRESKLESVVARGRSCGVAGHTKPTLHSRAWSATSGIRITIGHRENDAGMPARSRYIFGAVVSAKVLALGLGGTC
jgi:hypothetical protein